MNSFGRLFRVSIYGESHGDLVGVLLDGVPAGIKLTEDDFKEDILRRKSGKKGTTPRIESDIPHIRSGVFNGTTTGAPILIEFLNQNINDKDYSNLIDTPRPGHADYTAFNKYHGFNDYRGGGPFSGRLTLGIVAAGVVAKKILKDVKFESEIISLHHNKNKEEFEDEIKKAVENNDSIGGVVEVRVSNLFKGLGEPFFDSVESILSHLYFSVGAVKGVEFGIGFEGEALYGSEFNDPFIDEKGHTLTNHNGGINGGITNGNDIIAKIFVKPTPSVLKAQHTYNFKEGKMNDLVIKGRHDAAIILRAEVVLEACTAIGLADLYLVNKGWNESC